MTTQLLIDKEGEVLYISASLSYASLSQLLWWEINASLWAEQHLQCNPEGTMSLASGWHCSLRVTLDLLTSTYGNIYHLCSERNSHSYTPNLKHIGNSSTKTVHAVCITLSLDLALLLDVIVMAGVVVVCVVVDTVVVVGSKQQRFTCIYTEYFESKEELWTRKSPDPISL